MWLLLVLYLVTFGLLGMWLLGYLSKDHKYCMSDALYGLLVVALFGWGFLGGFYGAKQIATPVTVFEYKQTKSATLVEANGVIKFSNKASWYNSISSAKQVYIRESYNIYGGQLNRWLSLDEDGGAEVE